MCASARSWVQWDRNRAQDHLPHPCVSVLYGTTISCVRNQDVPDLHWSTANSHESWMLTAQCLLQQASLSLSPLWLSSYRFILSSSSPHPSLHEPSRRQSRPRSFRQPLFRGNPSSKAGYTMQSTLKDVFAWASGGQNQCLRKLNALHKASRESENWTRLYYRQHRCVSFGHNSFDI